jgi:hypothetical protein
MDGNIKRPDVDYLFHLSEIAFAVAVELWTRESQQKPIKLITIISKTKKKIFF